MLRGLCLRYNCCFPMLQSTDCLILPEGIKFVYPGCGEVIIIHPESKNSMLAWQVKGLYMMMGRGLERLEQVQAGNVLAIGGLEAAILKSATLSSTAAATPIAPMTFQVGCLAWHCSPAHIPLRKHPELVSPSLIRLGFERFPSLRTAVCRPAPSALHIELQVWLMMSGRPAAQVRIQRFMLQVYPSYPWFCMVVQLRTLTG